MQISVALRELRALVQEVAQEQKVVLRRDGHAVPHECRRVHDERGSHFAGDARVEGWLALEGGGLKGTRGREEWENYISGSFWVSIIAAMGIPKLDTGPQKSARVVYQLGS